MQPDISPNNMMESQSDFSSQETIIEPHVIIGRIQKWMQETTFLISLLQGIPPSDKTAVEKWLQEQKENGNTTLVTLLQSILSSAKTKIGSNFHLEAQHPKQSNKQISKAPKTRNSSGRKAVKTYLVTEEDKPLDEEALTEASVKMPEVRLVIKSPYIQSQYLETLAGSIRYPSRAPRFKNMFGVVQDTVDFTIKLDLRFNTHEEPFVFWCDIIYDPASNDCNLHNRSGRDIYLASSDEWPTRLMNADECSIDCGARRISIKPDQTSSCFYPIFDILVQDKRFGILVGNDDKVLEVSGIDLFHGETKCAPPSFRETRTNLFELVKGEAVRIEDLHDNEKTYELRQIENMTKLCPETERPHIFYCRHSKLPSIQLVAKVFRIREQMKREMEFLKQIRHPNIISLKEADPRVFALYLEELPRSLDKYRKLELSWADAKTILFDIASALAYLSKREIVHYDVKPANIAFCRERGAILFDFDLADYTKNPKYGSPGGTFGFLPPETIENGKSRGGPGDVWALGVTILCIMNLDTNSLKVAFDPNDFHKQDTFTYREVKEQLHYISKQRELLDLQVKVQSLVHRMLEPSVKKRVTAAAIHSEDDRKPESGRSARKRKHSSNT
ncbi:kinase-like domain-containing protein [Trichoderma austrokoningii]